MSYARANLRITQFQEDRNTIRPGSVPVQTFESIVEVDYTWIMHDQMQVRQIDSIRPFGDPRDMG